jgi:hypothetical protein
MNDELNYSMEARMRVALSASAARASTQAIALVPTYGEYGCVRGELAETAAGLARLAVDALTFAIACERQRGTSWERIAEVMGEKAGMVQRLYERPVARLQRRLLEAWLDPERAAILPEGAADPDETAARLDAWLADDIGRDAMVDQHPDSEVRARPVSGELPVMSLAEHRELLTSAARLIAEGDQSPHAESNLRRQRIALLEWLLAEELNRPNTTGSLDQHALRRTLETERRKLESTPGPNTA